MDLEAGVYGPGVDEWYRMHAGKSQVNYGTASGHEFARSKVTQNLPDDDLPVVGSSGQFADGLLRPDTCRIQTLFESLHV